MTFCLWRCFNFLPLILLLIGEISLFTFTFTPNLSLTQKKDWEQRGAAQQSPQKPSLMTGLSTSCDRHRKDYIWRRRKNLSRACNLQDELFSALLGPQAKSSCQVWKRDVILKNVKLFLHMTKYFWSYKFVQQIFGQRIKQILFFCWYYW